MPNLLSETQKQKIKTEFYENWRTCENEMLSRKNNNTITASRQPMIFALREIMKATGVSEEIGSKYDGGIHGILDELQLRCPTCGSKLSAHTEIGRYLGDDEFWHSFSNNIKPKRKNPLVAHHLKNPRPKNTRIENYKKPPVSVAKLVPQSKKLLIMSIDDSPQTLKVMEQIVTKQGCKFIGIQNSLQVLPTTITHNPDLIFLDLEMPIFNGYEICNQIRNVSKFKNKPVVMLTSNSNTLNKMKAKISGITEFIAKPININEILETIEKHLNIKNKVLGYPTKQSEISRETNLTGVAF